MVAWDDNIIMAIMAWKLTLLEDTLGNSAAPPKHFFINDEIWVLSVSDIFKTGSSLITYWLSFLVAKADRLVWLLFQCIYHS